MPELTGSFGLDPFERSGRSALPLRLRRGPRVLDTHLLARQRRRGNDGAASVYDAAATVLEELADPTEQAALASALVYRYIQAHSLWRGHPDANVTSAETFLDNLDNADYVKANIVIGSSADLSKHRSLKGSSRKYGAQTAAKHT